MSDFQLLEQANEGNTSLITLGLVELAIHQLWYVKQLFRKEEFKKTMWKGVVSWMCRNHEAKEELESFLEYINAVIEKNKQASIYMVFTVEKYEVVLEEYSFQVNGPEPEWLRQRELLDAVKKVLLMTRPDTDEGMDEELDYDMEMKVPPPLVIPDVKHDPNWVISITKHKIRVMELLEVVKEEDMDEGELYEEKSDAEESHAEESDAEESCAEKSYAEESDAEDSCAEDSGAGDEDADDADDGDASDADDEEADDDDELDEEADDEDDEDEIRTREDIPLNPSNRNELVEESENEWLEETESESNEESGNELSEESENEWTDESENEWTDESGNETEEGSEYELREEASQTCWHVENASAVIDSEYDWKVDFESQSEILGKMPSKKAEELKKKRVHMFETKERKCFREKESEASEDGANKCNLFGLVKEVRKLSNAHKSRNSGKKERLMHKKFIQTLKESAYDKKTVTAYYNRIYALVEVGMAKDLRNYEVTNDTKSTQTDAWLEAWFAEPSQIVKKVCMCKSTMTKVMWPTIKEKMPIADTANSFVDKERAEKAVKALKIDSFVPCKLRIENETMVKQINFEKGENSLKSQEAEKLQIVKGKEAAIQIKRVDEMNKDVIEGKSLEVRNAEQLNFETVRKREEAGKLLALNDAKENAQAAEKAKIRIPMEVEKPKGFLSSKNVEESLDFKEMGASFENIDYLRIIEEMESEVKEEKGMLNSEKVKKSLKSEEAVEELLVAKNVKVGKVNAVCVQAEATGNASNNEKQGNSKRQKEAKKPQAVKTNKKFSKLEITFGQINLGEFLNV